MTTEEFEQIKQELTDQLLAPDGLFAKSLRSAIDEEIKRQTKKWIDSQTAGAKKMLASMPLKGAKQE